MCASMGIVAVTRRAQRDACARADRSLPAGFTRISSRSNGTFTSTQGVVTKSRTKPFSIEEDADNKDKGGVTT